MASPVRCGCYYTLLSGRQASLPLQSVHAQVQIVDILARVTLIQLFANTSRAEVPAEAKYVFPVPVGGAVCAFEMRTADGKVIVGEVKESGQAEAEFREVISHNRTAGLLAKAAPDVFVMSLGAIPPRQAIKTTITYMIELADDELLKQVRFSLPTYIGARYGTPPSAMHSQALSAKYARFTMSAEIQTSSTLEQVVSPSHAVNVTMGNSGDPTPRCSVVLNPSAVAFLDKDFILSIKADKIDSPRCVAEVLENKNSVALSLTLVPRFGVKPIESQEYIFVIDRSGSMRGQSKMDYAKKALLIMLKSLPTNGTTFNIFSFGSSHSALWPASQLYSQATLSTAVSHVDSMDADMGGTEITSVVDSALQSRTTSRPTSVFILTDGEVWNVDPLLVSLRTSVSAAGDNSSGTYLRVFTLGIGHNASTALCNGLARAGNGLCLMTTQSEELAGKCSRLLRASRVPPSGNLRNVHVDWKYAGPAPALESHILQPAQPASEALEPAAVMNMFDDNYDPLAPTGDTGFPIALPAISDIQQAPSVVPDFYPGNRFIVSAILSKTTQIPDSVILRGETPDGQSMELNIPVQAARFPKPWPPLVHTLAAHRLIQELEDGYLDCLGITTRQELHYDKQIAKSAIVRYSTEYQLASKYASFIAAEKTTKDTAANEDSDFELLGESDIDLNEWVDDFEGPIDTQKTLDEHVFVAGAYVPSHTGYSRAKEAAEQEALTARAAPRQAPPLTQQSMTYSQPVYGGGSLSNPFARSMSGVTVHARMMQRGSPPSGEGVVLPMPQRLGQTMPRGYGVQTRTPAEPNPSDDPTTAIARLQSFDGSFRLDDTLRKLVIGDKLTLDALKTATPASIRSHTHSEEIWATAIAVAYLKTMAKDAMDIWVGLWEKANEYGAQALRDTPVSFDQLVEEAISRL
ncbi:VIT-domain-containing protein [Daedalea quercina L-15889]|uniref:VIT-domain-containing protein n=1 Tax=Daedalea quercina L-15889 TaxID=1314783 RepID=A0A165NDP6_9APHY|nr:VIT-domain-containing protein [Daedalea quercina L-15889]